MFSQEEPIVSATASCGSYEKHGRIDCVECRERLERAREVTAARHKTISEPFAQTHGAAPTQRKHTSPLSVEEAPVVRLAKNYSGRLEQLSPHEKQCIAAEASVKFLSSITDLKAEAETAWLGGCLS